VFSGTRFSRFNREYERCVAEEIRVHLGSTRERKIMVRFRCGNENTEREGWGIERRIVFLGFVFFFRYNCIQESESL
jgi:hypothetical protein